MLKAGSVGFRPFGFRISEILTCKTQGVEILAQVCRAQNANRACDFRGSLKTCTALHPRALNYVQIMDLLPPCS